MDGESDERSEELGRECDERSEERCVCSCDKRSEEHPRAERERFVPAAGPCYHGERSETAVAGSY